MNERLNYLKSTDASLADEILQEKASALGRLGRALETALAALADFDAVRAQSAPSGQDRDTRRRLVREAGSALWCFIVQRECCGLRNTSQLARDYRVPPEVWRRMGVIEQPQQRSGRQ
jgi:hypothetical protein